MNRPQVLVPALAAAVTYAAAVGWLQRYSWPATVSVVAVSVAAVLVAWRVSAGSGSEPERLSVAGVVAWCAVWAGAALWELAALNAVAHRRGSRMPTLDAVFTRVMHSRTGRIAVVAGWAWIGLHLFSK